MASYVSAGETYASQSLANGVSAPAQANWADKYRGVSRISVLFAATGSTIPTTHRSPAGLSYMFPYFNPDISSTDFLGFRQQ
mgnify:CR=1 FL=1